MGMLQTFNRVSSLIVSVETIQSLGGYRRQYHQIYYSVNRFPYLNRKPHLLFKDYKLPLLSYFLPLLLFVLSIYHETSPRIVDVKQDDTNYSNNSTARTT